MSDALFKVSADRVGKSRLRENLCSGKADFLQAYFVYVKEKRRRRGANYPQDAEGDTVGGRLNHQQS